MKSDSKAKRVRFLPSGNGVLLQSLHGPLDSEAHAAAVLQGAPVATLTGNEAPATGGMKALREWASALFASEQVGGKATNPRLGEVVLDERSVRSSSSHGMTRHKAAAFAAVSQVIEHGAVIAKAKGQELESFYISAPVSIGNVDDIVTALVRRDANTQRMYLHSVSTKENLLKSQDSSTDAVGAEQSSGKLTSGEVASVLQKLLTLNPDTLNQPDRATFHPATNTITLLKAADLSSFLHEAALVRLSRQSGQQELRAAQRLQPFGNFRLQPEGHHALIIRQLLRRIPPRNARPRRRRLVADQVAPTLHPRDDRQRLARQLPKHQAPAVGLATA